MTINNPPQEAPRSPNVETDISSQQPQVSHPLEGRACLRPSKRSDEALYQNHLPGSRQSSDHYGKHGLQHGPTAAATSAEVCLPDANPAKKPTERSQPAASPVQTERSSCDRTPLSRLSEVSKWRNRIKIILGRLKDWRRMATRYGPMPKGIPFGHRTYGNRHLLIVNPDPHEGSGKLIYP